MRVPLRPQVTHHMEQLAALYQSRHGDEQTGRSPVLLLAALVSRSGDLFGQVVESMTVGAMASDEITLWLAALETALRRWPESQPLPAKGADRLLSMACSVLSTHLVASTRQEGAALIGTQLGLHPMGAQAAHSALSVSVDSLECSAQMSI